MPFQRHTPSIPGSARTAAAASDALVQQQAWPIPESPRERQEGSTSNVQARDERDLATGRGGVSLGTDSPLSVTLFGKPGCCLCDRATAALGRLSVDLPLEVAHVDITTDPALFDLYRHRIPVVMTGGEVLDEGKVTEFRLRLACEQRGWLREQR